MREVELPVGAGAALTKDLLPLWKAVALGLAAMQLGPSLALAAGYLLLATPSGTWLAMAMAVLVMLCVVAPINVFARRFIVTGSLTSYIAHALPPTAVTSAAACQFAGYLFATASLAASAVLFISSALLDMGIPGGATSLGIAIETLSAVSLSVFAAYRGIDTSVRVATLLGSICLPPLLLTIGAALLRHPVAIRTALSLQGSSLSSISQATLLAIGFYVGFDGLTSLAAETRDPLRNVPRILAWALGGTGVVLVIACLVQEPQLREQSAALAGGASPIAVLADVAGLSWIKTPIDALLALASIASMVSYINFGARIVGTIAADGLLPASFALIHPRYHSPHRAVVFLGIVGVAAPVILRWLVNGSLLLTSAYLTNMAAYCWAIPYMLVCVGALLLQHRSGGIRIFTCVASCIVLLAFGYIVLLGFETRPDDVNGIVPYVAFGAMILAAIYFYFMGRRVLPTSM